MHRAQVHKTNALFIQKDMHLVVHGLVLSVMHLNDSSLVLVKRGYSTKVIEFEHTCTLLYK